MPIRVLVAAPANSIGGQAHAARDIVGGFAGSSEVMVGLQPIDPVLPGALGLLTSLRLIRSVVRPVLYTIQLLGRASRVDVFHVFAAAHTAFYFGAFPAILVATLFRRPIILNYHDGRADAHLSSGGRLLRWLIRRADHLVVPSKYLVEVFACHGYPARLIPNAVDLERYRAPAEGPLTSRLVSFRALEPLYAVENTIAAFAIVQSGRPGLRLDIYGDGPSRAALEQAVAAQRLSGVHFHGAVRHAEIPAILSKGGVVVNSSRVDNAPLFILEAFAAGLPVVTTRAGGIPGMVEHDRTGLLVDLDDPEGLAMAIDRVLSEPGVATRLAKAGRVAVEQYTWTAVGPRWADLYRTAAARNR